MAFDKDRYLKDDTPPPLTQGKRLEVTLNMDVQNILNIKEVKNIFSLKFKLEETWKDSRLSYYNLKEDQELNSLIYLTDNRSGFLQYYFPTPGRILRQRMMNRPLLKLFVQRKDHDLAWIPMRISWSTKDLKMKSRSSAFTRLTFSVIMK